MNPRDPGIDVAFEGLRGAHRSQRVPAELRRRVLERARVERSLERKRPRPQSWLSRGSGLALAAAVGGAVWFGAVWFGVARPALDGSSAARGARQGVIPTAEPTSAAPRVCPSPLPISPWNMEAIDRGAEASGLRAQVLQTDTLGCGPLTRRYLVRVPAEHNPSAPVLIVLHDGGQNPSLSQIETRWWFDDVADRESAVLVYANGSPPVGPAMLNAIHAGVWQTDEGVHPAVDDSLYFQAIVDDLRERRGLAQGEIFLAGYGSGAVMALSAALQHPDRFAGVAAFLPARPPRPAELVSAPGAALAGGQRHLRSIFLTLPETAGESPSALALKWAATFGSEAGPLRVTRQKPGISRIEATFASGVGLSISTLPPQVNPFPGPGGADPLARAASAMLPFFFDGPGAAWDFFKRAQP
jgi:poly(3-hydroxybutyrate) depolymerase